MSDFINAHDNPLLETNGIPAYDRIEPHHVSPAMDEIIERAERRLEQIESAPGSDWDSLLKPLEEIGVLFERSWGAVSHLLSVKNSAELREAHEATLPKIVAFHLRFGQSEPVYNALKQLRDGPQWRGLDEAQQRIINGKMLDAELSGVALNGTSKERFNEIAKELSQLGTDFSNNVLDATKAFAKVIDDPAELDGVPHSFKQLCAQSYNTDRLPDTETATPEHGPWKLTLDLPCFLPLQKFCRNRSLREELYRVYMTRAAHGEFDNSTHIDRILRLRTEKSKLLGFSDFAHVSLSQKMAPSVEAVQEMFERLRDASWASAENDLQDCQQLAVAEGQQDDLQPWDIAFWAERLRESRFDYSDEDLRPYFPLDQVLDGMFQLVSELFDVEVQRADGDAPVWHPDVRFFHIKNAAGERISSFYLDPFSRPENKRGGAWMDTCLGRRYVDGQLQLPVAHLVCNSTPPVGDTPSLMTFSEVTTLFHEFGHGLQHLLTTVDYADAAGINNVEWDAVELPSQFMENWCYHRPTVMQFSGHHQSGLPLPEELFDKVCAARTFRAGSLMLRQLNFGMTDMELHSTFDPDGAETVFDVQQRISKQTSVLPPLPEDRMLCGFQHIFAGGYAAGYYSYKWAEVLSADAFAAFEEAGLDNPDAISETGRRFRDTVLAQGGGRNPMDIFRDFRGREPNPDALLRHNGLLGE